jgi:hypothetical protein
MFSLIVFHGAMVAAASMCVGRVVTKRQARLDVVAKADRAIDDVWQLDDDGKRQCLLIFNPLLSVTGPDRRAKAIVASMP